MVGGGGGGCGWWRKLLSGRGGGRGSLLCTYLRPMTEDSFGEPGRPICLPSFVERIESCCLCHKAVGFHFKSWPTLWLHSAVLDISSGMSTM